MDKSSKNPLVMLWNILGTFGGILSLSSMVQNWASDIVKWRGFILTLMESYQSIVRPLFGFIFQWVPFDIPFWIHDYLVFGLVVAASEYKASKHHGYYKKAGLSIGRYIYTRNKYTFVAVLIINELLQSPFGIAVRNTITWPLVLRAYPSRIHLYHKRKRRPTFVRQTGMLLFTYKATLWIATIILGSTVLLSVNALL